MTTLILLDAEEDAYVQAALDGGLTLSEAVEQLHPELIGMGWELDTRFDRPRRFVTHEMALDAGCPEMEGMEIEW